MSAERIVKDAQIARRPQNTIDYDGQRYSLHTYYDTYSQGYKGPKEGNCPATVYSPVGIWHHVPGQCQRKGKLECEGYHWCATHYPPNVVARRLAIHARHEAEAERNRLEWDARDKERKMRDAALKAIKQIADGHNDPRGLAMEVLGRKAAEG